MHHIGIAGAGNISETHVRAVLAIPGARVAAVYGMNAERAGRMAALAGAQAYTDWDQFLSHQPMDTVLLGTPSGLHARQGCDAARRGLHVLSEKPLDTRTDEIDALIGEAERMDVKVGVFFQDRTSPDLIWLKQLIDSGGLGTPILATAHVKWYRPPEYFTSSRWRATWDLDGGGALMNQGVHTLDVLLWLFGDVERVSGRIRTLLHEIEVEDTVVAALEFANGALGTLEATTAAYPGYPRRLELTGSNGTVIVESDRVIAADLRSPPESPPPGGEGLKNASSTSAVVADASGHRRVLEDFLHAIDSDTVPLCDAHEGRRSVELAEAIYQSAKSGEPVSLRQETPAGGQ